MLNDEFRVGLSPLQKAIQALTREDESTVAESLLEQAMLPADSLKKIQEIAHSLVHEVRKERVGQGGIDAFMFQYDLSTEEGIALMCMAEALLRIPDKDTIDLLIKDKISKADWAAHLGKSASTFVNAATWALMLTGKVISPETTKANFLTKSLKRLTARSGEPIIRKSVVQAMRILSKQFVMGRDVGEAIERAKALEAKNYRYSYDMLGEAAYTAEDAQAYYCAYQEAISAIKEANHGVGPEKGPGISVKLSALHPRYEFSQRTRVMTELLPRLKNLAKEAMDANIGFTVDAEEADRLELSLELIEAILIDPEFAGWDGFGLAVQAYQKRALPVLDWLIETARANNRKIMIRLVKGAYWDTEVKLSQEGGHSGYPVFTRKITTDTSYIACVKKLLAARDVVFPQFATHNAHTVATVMTVAENNEGFEFQCLHGMGEALYNQVVGANKMGVPCRIYAPVGTHEDLLAYLVRRLLENGANSSFVNRIVDQKLAIEEITADPVAKLQRASSKPHPCIPLPEGIFGAERLNSKGVDLANSAEFLPVLEGMEKALEKTYTAKPSVECLDGLRKNIVDPANNERIIGTVLEATLTIVPTIVENGQKAYADWSHTSVEHRAALLEVIARKLQENREALMGLLCREAGKTLSDAVSEVREAIDFCYYYAHQARTQLSTTLLPGPTGEHNELSFEGRGVIACISPWNFPVAIFLGQVVAAVVAGNSVIAKPAEQTPLVAQYLIDLIHQTDIPNDVVQLLPGEGSIVGDALVSDERIKGVMFTGSTETAKRIQQTLAGRPGAIVPLIAETGGQNAMIVDSSALAEQVVSDVIESAFMSAGQRCSAMRILFVQSDVADRIIHMLEGAIAELSLGDPMALSTDIGPVIDSDALAMLNRHLEKMQSLGRSLARVEVSQENAEKGNFFAPCAFEIDNIDCLEREVFGPFLHIVRYESTELEAVIDRINQTGYGLTLGVHSRIAENVDLIVRKAKVGNLYVNRNMVGAVVGVQPFGGEGLSGTGPKAGGPNYLQRLCTEKTLSINTTAAGGNASLMSLTE